MKRTVKLTERELKRMISESVKNVLRESTLDDVYSDVDGKIKTVQEYIDAVDKLEELQGKIDTLDDYTWKIYDSYEEALGSPMWPDDDRGKIEGAERLLKVLKSMKGENNYLQSYDRDWTKDERDGEDYMRTDGQTWGQYWRDNLSKMSNYNK